MFILILDKCILCQRQILILFSHVEHAFSVLCDVDTVAFPEGTYSSFNSVGPLLDTRLTPALVRGRHLVFASCVQIASGEVTGGLRGKRRVNDTPRTVGSVINIVGDANGTVGHADNTVRNIPDIFVWTAPLPIMMPVPCQQQRWRCRRPCRRYMSVTAG